MLRGRQAGLRRLAGLRGFWLEFKMTGAPYRPRRFLLVRDRMARRRRRSIVMSFVLLVAVSLGLVAWQGALGPALETARMTFLDLVTPVSRSARTLAARIASAFSGAGSSKEDLEQIARLRRQVAELEVWRIRAGQLENKLAELGRLAEVVTKPNLPFLTADVVGVGADPHRLQLMIAAGADHGLKPGYPVIEAEGLVGTVETTARRFALVRMVEDSSMAFGALIGPSRIPARLIGRGRSGLQITLPEWQRRQIGPGDLVVTSGDDGRLPRGLLVGRVDRDGPDIVVRVFATAVRRHFISVLRFDPIRSGGDAGGRTGPSPMPARPPAAGEVSGGRQSEGAQARGRSRSASRSTGSEP